MGFPKSWSTFTKRWDLFITSQINLITVRGDTSITCITKQLKENTKEKSQTAPFLYTKVKESWYKRMKKMLFLSMRDIGRMGKYKVLDAILIYREKNLISA